MRKSSAELLHLYYEAKSLVVDAGFSGEIEWSASLGDQPPGESEFLRESAWVILCGGFRESVVRSHFSYISLCFCDWENARLIVKYSADCVQTAKRAFANERKLLAILGVAQLVEEETYEVLSARISSAPLVELQRLPHIGAITAQHLAKNLGFPVAKDDRHLRRLAAFLRFENAQSLCEAISWASGESVQVVDTVLWRACVQRFIAT